jgi:hypothetical protein
MIESGSNYAIAVKALRETLNGMSGNWFSQLTMSILVNDFISQSRDAHHRRINWSMSSKRISTCIVVFSMLPALVSILWLGVLGDFDGYPEWMPLLACLPAVILVGYYAEQKVALKRKFAKLHDAFLSVANEVSSMIHRDDIKETIILIGRGHVLRGSEYIRIAAYLLDRDVIREKSKTWIILSPSGPPRKRTILELKK